MHGLRMKNMILSDVGIAAVIRMVPKNITATAVREILDETADWKEEWAERISKAVRDYNASLAQAQEGSDGLSVESEESDEDSSDEEPLAMQLQQHRRNV